MAARMYSHNMAIFLVKPALTNVAKSPNSWGISCRKTDIDASPPLDFNSENAVVINEELVWEE